jgi:hypothetical protein
MAVTIALPLTQDSKTHSSRRIHRAAEQSNRALLKTSEFDNMRRLSNYRLLNNAPILPLLVVSLLPPVSSLTTFA